MFTKTNGYLKDKQVYLAGAMYALEDDGVSWREQLRPRLETYGLKIVDPTNKNDAALSEIEENKQVFRELILQKEFSKVRELFDPIVSYDLRAVDHSHAIIAYYDPTVHTVGTIHEFIIAHTQKKPLLVKYDEEHLNQFNVWITKLVRPEWLFDTWDSMFDYINKIDRREFSEEDLHFWTRD